MTLPSEITYLCDFLCIASAGAVAILIGTAPITLILWWQFFGRQK